jgi:hypothetical protein
VSAASLSEEYAFCRRWTDIASEIWIDIRSKLAPIGLLSFIGEVATQLRQSAA